MEWIYNLKNSGIFKRISSANIMALDAGGIPWEHSDSNTPDEPVDYIREFIHIKTDCDRPFYIIDPETGERVFMNTRAAWWNETVWHGGLPIQRPTYTLRINGRFTEEFRTRIGATSII